MHDQANKHASYDQYCTDTTGLRRSFEMMVGAIRIGRPIETVAGAKDNAGAAVFKNLGGSSGRIARANRKGA
jgi:hypothetical protein